MSLNSAIKEGVAWGFAEATRPGGPMSNALDAAFAPLHAEIKRLRLALYWRPPHIHPRPDEPVIVSVNGDLFFARWVAPEGAEEGYWDSDLDYGGNVIKPDRWFRLPPIDNSAMFPPKAEISEGEG